MRSPPDNSTSWDEDLCIIVFLPYGSRVLAVFVSELLDVPFLNAINTPSGPMPALLEALLISSIFSGQEVEEEILIGESIWPA